MNYAVHSADGKIRAVYDAPTQAIADAQCAPGEVATLVAEAVSDAADWIKPETMRRNARTVSPCTPSRTELPADGETALTLSQMRPNTVITVTGPISATMTVKQGGSDTIRFHKPGTYTITAEAPFPAMPKEITINAT